MAVGASFALAAKNGHDPTMYNAAMALAIGIGIRTSRRRCHFFASASRSNRKVFRFRKSFRVSRIDFRRIDGVNRRTYPAL